MVVRFPTRGLEEAVRCRAFPVADGPVSGERDTSPGIAVALVGTDMSTIVLEASLVPDQGFRPIGNVSGSSVDRVESISRVIIDEVLGAGSECDVVWGGCRH